MKRWKLTEVQADAILNMRLRALRKLEEFEIRAEHKTLSEEKRELTRLLRDKDRRWDAIAGEIEALRKQYGPKTPLGRRRTELAEAPSAVVVPIEAFIEREPITVICSEKGWIRAAKGHLGPDADLKYKEGDSGRFLLHAQTTDKLLVFGTNGRFYTLPCDKLPGGRGQGEPLRLMIDLGNDQDIVDLKVLKGGRKFMVASSAGRGFVVPEDETVAQTRNGRQVLNLAKGEKAAVCAVVADGDNTVAVIGENRKLLLFPLAEVPEMTRGRGVILQKYKDGGLSDVKTFARREGLTWSQGERTRTETDLRPWIGKRAQAGRLPPTGFTRSNKF
jgi:topoisomerase-4 subunit A